MKFHYTYCCFCTWAQNMRFHLKSPKSENSSEINEILLFLVNFTFFCSFSCFSPKSTFFALGRKEKSENQLFENSRNIFPKFCFCKGNQFFHRNFIFSLKIHFSLLAENTNFDCVFTLLFRCIFIQNQFFGEFHTFSLKITF